MTLFIFQRTSGALASLFYCGIHVGRGKLSADGLSRSRLVDFCPHWPWLQAGVAGRSVGASFLQANLGEFGFP
jgi:hypothetical protein